MPSSVVISRLAREIAIDIYDLETILGHHGITLEQYETISKHPLFQKTLIDERSTWNSALSVNDRVKIKSATMLEDWLPELNSRMHDPNENLNHKIEAGKLISRLAGIGVAGADLASAGGERISININLGEDNKLSFEKKAPARVIENVDYQSFDQDELSAGIEGVDD